MIIETERLLISPLSEMDEKEIVKWRNQQEIIKNLFSSNGTTLEEHRQWFASYEKKQDRVEFVISIKEGNRKIGTIGLSQIDHVNHKAEYGILIGEKDERGKGFAFEASTGILQYGFRQLSLNKIYLKVFKDNVKAIRLYRKLGFQEEGVLKHDILKHNQYRDVLVMAILHEEWNK